jgi:hypothetical protein
MHLVVVTARERGVERRGVKGKERGAAERRDAF